jgi:hypothetical protein
MSKSSKQAMGIKQTNNGIKTSGSKDRSSSG